MALRADLSDSGAVKDMVALAQANLGAVGILVNHSGNARLKGGAAGFMRTTERTPGRQNITAHCVATALSKTAVVQRAIENNPDALEHWIKKYVVRRTGESGDITNIILFLTSYASSWINGQIYLIRTGFRSSL